MRGRWGAAVAVLVTTIAVAGCQPVQPWRNELASPNAEGTGGSTGTAREVVFSPDGTKVAFVTEASDLGPTDTNEDDDVYVRDLVAGTTTLVSANAAGTDAGDAASSVPTFNHDGTKVAFLSSASDLVPGQGGGTFVRDLVAGTTTFVSGGGYPQFSPTADEVVVAGGQVMVVDLATGEETLVSAGPDGAPGNGESAVPTWSPDGTKVAFQSYASDLVAGADTNGTSDVFVRDLVAGTTTLASVNAAGDDSGTEHSYIGSVGRDAFTGGGDGIVFTSLARDLVTNDDNLGFDVFVHDLTTGTTEAVSVGASGTTGTGSSMYPNVSPDGRRVAFSSDSIGLVEGVDDPFTTQVYVRDLVAGTTVLASVGPDGGPGNGSSGGVPWSEAGDVFSPDGTRLVFPSVARDLGARDTNRCPAPNGGEMGSCVDVYAHDLGTGATTLVSADAEGTDSGNGTSQGAVFSPVDDRIAFVSAATNLGPPDMHYTDVYLATLTGADMSVVLDAPAGPVATGDSVTWTMTVANAGPDTAEDAVAALHLPDGVGTPVVATTAGTCAPPPPEQPRLVVCEFGDAAVGPVAEVSVTATVTAAPGTTLTAVARATSATGVDPATTNDVRRSDTTVS